MKSSCEGLRLKKVNDLTINSSSEWLLQGAYKINLEVDPTSNARVARPDGYTIDKAEGVLDTLLRWYLAYVASRDWLDVPGQFRASTLTFFC